MMGLWSAACFLFPAVTQDGGQVVLEGTGQGHGIGLCQAGAKAMAEHGANFRRILVYYYPNTELTSLLR
jgi:stage II sporulation protein D